MDGAVKVAKKTRQKCKSFLSIDVPAGGRRKWRQIRSAASNPIETPPSGGRVPVDCHRDGTDDNQMEIDASSAGASLFFS